MNYRRAVAEGRRLHAQGESAQWELARLTYEVTVIQGESLVTWAADLRVSEAHVSHLRNVWAKFGELYDRKGLTNRTFNDCYVLARSSPERREEIERKAGETGKSVGTVDRAHRDGDRDRTPPKDRPGGRDDRPRSRKEQIREVRAFLRDQRNFDDVFEDDGLDKRARRKYREPHEPPPPPPHRGEQLRLDTDRDFEDLWEEFNHLLYALMPARISKQRQRELMKVAENFRNSIGWLESLLLEGDRSFGDRLRELVGEPAETPPAKRRKSPPPEDALPAPEGNGSPPGRERGGRKRERPADEPGPGRRRRGSSGQELESAS